MDPTRHHMLRQGRGAGFLAALAGGPEVEAELIECVLNDPRWDQQVESRSDYYARLLLAVGADLSQLGERLDQVDRDDLHCSQWLQHDVFERIDELSGPSPQTSNDAADALHGTPTPPGGDRPDVAPGSDKDAVHNNRYAAATEARLLLRLRNRRDAESRQTLFHAAGSGTIEKQVVAIKLLGEIQDPALLPLVIAHLTAETAIEPSERRQGRLRGAYLRYLESLPPDQTLPIALDWLDRAWPLSLAAERIFARHATAEHRSLLEPAGYAALAEGDVYRFCSIVDALATAGPDDSAAFFIAVCEQAEYSYARGRAVHAMSRCNSHALVGPWLIEALWDCEPATREWACSAIRDTSASTLTRVRDLSNDQHEDPSVRQAAQAALMRLTK